jgi:hypothetical protein
MRDANSARRALPRVATYALALESDTSRTTLRSPTTATISWFRARFRARRSLVVVGTLPCSTGRAILSRDCSTRRAYSTHNDATMTYTMKNPGHSDGGIALARTGAIATLAVALGDALAIATVSCRCVARRSLFAVVVGVVLLCSLSPQLASAAGGFRASRAEPPRRVCSGSTPGRAECMAIHVPFVPAKSPDAVGAAFAGSGVGGGYTPAELRAAYKIPGTGGSGQTVAVVDAYNDPDAEANLKTYREKYGLPECTKASKCFNEVNQNGEAEPLPKEEQKGWGLEMSVDLDMVSAACPECKILLVEAENSSLENLGKAENAAAAKSVNTISNSWGAKELESYAAEYGSYFKHEGIPITVSSGDDGYGVEFPAGSPYVIAVGGTSLKMESKSERGWLEEVWRNTEKKVGEEGAGTGSGCTFKGEPKPAWQHDKGCANRTDNDVAAEASASTPVSIYDSYEYTGWELVGGTSVAAPIVAGVEALAEKSVKELGAKVFYEKPKHEFEVAKGSNGTCTPPAEDEYLCTAGAGYNGPAGMGALDGVPTLGAFATTGLATGITESEATVHGKVNPEGTETKYYFEYGTTEAYGTKTAEASAGSGTSLVEESKTITGLAANTKYYYRIVATNTKGASDVGGGIFCTHWCVQEAPLPAEAGHLANILSSVACPSSTECAAVGESENTSGVFVSLAERWNGIEWAVQETTIPTGSKFTQLRSVACPSSTECTAVGDYGVEHFVPLAERWNGTVWSVQEPPAPTGAKETYLTGISCPSSTACMAVGSFENSSGTTVPVAERWNGTSWSVEEPPPPTGAKHSELSGVSSGVSCPSASECIAVGLFENSSGKTVPLAEKWNGTVWSIQEPPTPTEAKWTELKGVSCTSSTACTAVGYFESSSAKWLPLAERWNGSTWTVQEPPLPTKGTTGEFWAGAVSCTSSTECMAQGTFENGSGKLLPLAERWNGTAWSAQEPSIHTGAAATEPYSVSCTWSTECTAVGWYESSSITQLLVERGEFSFVSAVTTGSATPVAENEATLHGTVNPEGAETKYYFEYGTTESYGSKTVEASAGSGASNVEVSNAVTGLASHTKYYYRLVAKNSNGTTDGAAQTFTTT